MMEQSSIPEEQEVDEMMNVEEVARTIDWFKAHGLNDADICDYLKYVATGVGLSEREPSKDRESE